jgi:type VI secretion system FHA domain protein
MPNLSEEATFVRPVVPPSAPVAPAPTAKASSGGTAAGEQAVQAFLEGAGLAHLKVPDAEAFMRESGVMVRAAIEGLMMLLIAREKMRTDLGAPPDPSAGDNPLKSMADPAEVIQFLFDPRRPAIANADPVQAFSDACSELRAHQVALYEAMQAAVKSALKSVDPKRIEREHGVNVGGLNLTRKSKLWDVAVAAHEKLMREAEEDFSKAFGREILAAYSDQLHKIRGGR